MEITCGTIPTRLDPARDPLQAPKAERLKGNISLSGLSGMHLRAIYPNSVYEAVDSVQPSSND